MSDLSFGPAHAVFDGLPMRGLGFSVRAAWSMLSASPAAREAARIIADRVPIAPRRLYFLREKTCFVFIDAAEQIYRVPKTRRMMEAFVDEYRLLDRLRPNLPVPIPDARLFGGDPPVARYRAIPGRPLPRLIERLRVRGQTSWIEDLARTLVALHAVPVADLDRPAHFVGERARLRRLLLAKGATALAAELEAAGREARGALAGADASVLCHGDLKGANMLVDPATGRLAGLIDFGSAGRGARESDLARTRLPSPELSALVSRYEALAGHALDHARFAAFLRFERACHAASRAVGPDA